MWGFTGAAWAPRWDILVGYDGEEIRDARTFFEL
jgi:hypothetical protein